MRRNRRVRTFITLAIVFFVLWQFWQKMHIVLWVNVPWWGLLIGVVAVIIALDLLIDNLLGKDS